MGFYTNITISNDFFHEIANKDPKALVDAISIGMNDGAGGDHPISDTFDAKPDASEYRKRLAFKRRYQGAPRGVIVHKTQHADIPQVIVSTYGSHALAAHELPYAIRNGWLDLSAYNEKHAEEIARELHKLARDIRAEIRQAKASQ